MQKTSVVVINYNTVDHLRTCLASLRTAGADDILVKDNGSSDGSVDMVRTEFPAVRIHPDRGNPGYGTASNQGIAATARPYVLLLNSDTILQPDSAVVLERYLDDHPRCGIVGPRLHNVDGTLQRSGHKWPSPMTLRPLVKLVPGFREQSILTWLHDRDRVVAWVKGAVLQIRRTAFDEVGGFDPAFFMYFEETDLSFRLRRAGWETHFTNGTVVTHAGGASTGFARAQMAVQFHGSMRRFYARHYPPRRLRQLDAVLKGQMLYSLLRDRTRLALTRDPERAARLSEDIRVWRRVLGGDWPKRPPTQSPGSY